MDSSVSHALELALSFMLFVIGLSTFLLMYTHTVTMMDLGVSNQTEDHQVYIYEGDKGEVYTTTEEIYGLLTEGAMRVKENWIGEVSYVSDTSKVSIYVDGVEYVSVEDYKGKQSLRRELLSITSTEFDKSYTVNDHGDIVQINYTGR